jgi:hypothetical protein
LKRSCRCAELIAKRARLTRPVQRTRFVREQHVEHRHAARCDGFGSAQIALERSNNRASGQHFTVVRPLRRGEARGVVLCAEERSYQSICDIRPAPVPSDSSRANRKRLGRLRGDTRRKFAVEPHSTAPDERG